MLIRRQQLVITARRRGSLMPAMGVALFACGACLALVLNQYWLSDAQEELRSAAESAALAGARQLACDDLLKEDFDSRRNANHVREIVEVQGERNPVSGRVRARMDVHLGKVHLDPETGHQEAEETDDMPTNVLVVAHRDRRRGNPVGMIAPAFTGRQGADVTVTSEASICNLVSGLRPVGQGRIPAWPLAILETSEDERLACWVRQIEQRQGADAFGWDNTDRAVTLDADGLPEITLTPPVEDQPGNVCLIDIGAGLNAETLDRQFREGWSAEDLADHGGELSLVNGPFHLPGTSNLQDLDKELLERHIGQARILLLYTKIDATAEAMEQVNISRMVAARLMAVRDDEGALQLIFQPAVVATRTAVIDQDALSQGAAEGNPYVYKISLTQ